MKTKNGPPLFSEGDQEWRVGDEGGEKVRVGREEKGSGLFFGIVLNQHHSCFEEKRVVPKVSAIKGLIQFANLLSVHRQIDGYYALIVVDYLLTNRPEPA